MASSLKNTAQPAQTLLNMGKRGAAQYCFTECTRARTLASAGTTNPKNLNELLDILLTPCKPIDDKGTIDWCKWLVAAGNSPEEFTHTVKSYDNATICGRVWTPNFVAYRCRTCGTSPSVSLCSECFKKGNHITHGHDWKMFLSQAGGACDCGNTSVMRETGFCDRHGPNASINKPTAPSNLMIVAEAVMPRFILRLIQHLREKWKIGLLDYSEAVKDANHYLNMLTEFDNMGCLMRNVITAALTNPQKYQELSDPSSFCGRIEFFSYCQNSNQLFQDALNVLSNLDRHEECSSSHIDAKYTTFLEELMFWTVVYEFPQQLVCLLIKMLPDLDYKESFTRAFILHYNRISMMLERSTDPVNLSFKVVHVSVQLFSNESLAIRMVDEEKLLHVMLTSLKNMMTKILIKNTLHNPDQNFHYVVDCTQRVMKEHCFWPLVSDLNNILCHKAISEKFMNDDTLLKTWFEFLSMIQGMNVNCRELNEHALFESDAYFSAFSTELQASGLMWALISNLRGPESVGYTRRILRFCLTALQNWFDAINYTSPKLSGNLRFSFHLPLHRHYAVFLCQAVRHQGDILTELLPSTDVLHLIMMHPLCAQVKLYEIIHNDLWVRNGLQIRGQALTYVRNDFCNSMIDADIYLLQVCAMKLSPKVFLTSLLSKFHVDLNKFNNISINGGFDVNILESCLTLLAVLISVRTNLGISDHEISRLEMVTLLCMGDKTHSQLKESMPERCGTSQNIDFESLLAEVADYKPPNLDSSSNELPQGMYGPKQYAWDELFDPVYILLRNVEKKDFSHVMKKFTDHARQTGKLKSNVRPWPPFRSPAAVSADYDDPRLVLNSKIFHTMIFITLYEAVNSQNVSENVLSLAIYLLEMAVETAEVPKKSTHAYCQNNSCKASFTSKNNNLVDWFDSDNLFENLRTFIPKVVLKREQEQSGSDSLIKREESILSLLLKLCLQLSKVSGIFNANKLTEDVVSTSTSTAKVESRVGDGTYFITMVLIKIAKFDLLCKKSITDIINELNENMLGKQIHFQKEAGRERAKERQLNTIAEFVNKQKQFMENSEKLDFYDVQSDSNTKMVTQKEYYCIICNQSSLSTTDKPMGLVILLQSTSAIGHERRNSKNLILPTSDEDQSSYFRNDNRSFYVKRRNDELKHLFEIPSWSQSINIGVEGGVYVRTCNHHVHVDCLQNYLPYAQSQYSSERHKKLVFEKGEYQCPLCRQIANSILPLTTQLSKSSTVVKSQQKSTIFLELDNFLNGKTLNADPSNLSSAIEKTVEDLNNSVYLQYSTQMISLNSEFEIYSQFLFISSIIRTNLEIELIQFGGSLCNLTSSKISLILKNNCTTALLQLLAMYAKKFKKLPDIHTWQNLTGLQPEPNLKLGLISEKKEVPLLLKDPIALLIQFVLRLALDFNEMHFFELVKFLFNLLYYQVLIQISCNLSQDERHAILDCKSINNDTSMSTSKDVLRNIVNYYRDSELYYNDVSSPTNHDRIKSVAIEQQVQILCLPFLRVASLIQYRLFERPLPVIFSSETEFLRLANYLELISKKTEWTYCTTAALHWKSKKNSDSVPKYWFEELGMFIHNNKINGRKLIIDQHILWQQPKLLTLPTEYEKIFLYYHKRTCGACQNIPQELSLCLLCGIVVCLKRRCCENSSINDSIKHSIDCGGGIGIFLVVESTNIVVIRGLRTRIWGSLYLDEFEEEDQYLKRGKPLYLSLDRYRLLEQEWLEHRFDHSYENWTLQPDVQ